MSSNNEETLRQFCDVTGADESRSRFFLESSNWQLEVALSSFYEHGGTEEAPANPPPDVNAMSEPSDSDMESAPGSPVKVQKKDKKPKRSGNQNFATLSSLQQESSSDEEEGQAFYAGGSDRSGQQIIGPGKKDIVSEMFKSVRERGAVGIEDEPSTARGGAGSGPFGGVGYRLGQTPDDHEPVATSAAAAAGGSATRSVRLRLYREGFSVDDGPIRVYTEPRHAHFLNSIRRGEIPAELSSGGAEVRVSLEDHRHEECPRQRGKPMAFGGKGQMLGSPTPPTVGATAPVAAAAADREANERAARAAVALDEAQPVTNIQFRLADGTRLTGRFNHAHTVGQLREYVVAAAPAYQLQSFALMTAFPSVELTDPLITLAEANLLNSVVIQRMK